MKWHKNDMKNPNFDIKKLKFSEFSSPETAKFWKFWNLKNQKSKLKNQTIYNSFLYKLQNIDLRTKIPHFDLNIFTKNCPNYY